MIVEMGRENHCSDSQLELIKKLRGEGITLIGIGISVGLSIDLVANALKPQKHANIRGCKRKT